MNVYILLLLTAFALKIYRKPNSQYFHLVKSIFLLILTVNDFLLNL